MHQTESESHSGGTAGGVRGGVSVGGITGLAAIRTDLLPDFGIIDRLRQIRLSLPFEIEWRMVNVNAGRQTIPFLKPFTNRPVVVANYAEVRDSFISRALQTTSLNRLQTLRLPRLSNFKTHLDTSALKPWGDAFYDWALEGCRTYGIPESFCSPFVILFKYVGNLFFFAYYGATGDFETIGKAISSKIIENVEASINSYIDNAINRGMIAEIENKVNNLITTLSERLNAIPHEFMQTLGYRPDANGRYSLPVSVTVYAVSTTNFVVEVPRPGVILYIAIARKA